MNAKKLSALMLTSLFLLVGGLGFAAAQNESGDDAMGGDGTMNDTGAGQDDQQQDDAGDMEAYAVCGLDGEDGDNAAYQVADTSADATVARTQSRVADIDRDDVFNALAINANNDQAIEFNELADVDATVSESSSIRSTSGFDEADVFSALALGITADGGSELDALACVADRTATQTMSQTISQRVNLDREDTLLAIALANSGDSELDWRDVADISRTESRRQSVDRDVNIDEDETFLALALGLGGRGGGE